MRGISVGNGNKDLVDTWRLLMKGCVAVLVMGLCVGACSYFNDATGLDDDHAGEYLMERVVEFHLGLDPHSVDFTPDE